MPRERNQQADAGPLGLSLVGIKDKLRKGRLNIAVVGLGRIGLPTAALFAESGAVVTGLDIDSSVVNEINSGVCRFADEVGLPEIVARTVREGKLKATTSGRVAVSQADFVISCVPTPVDQTKTPDYAAVEAASREIGRSLKKGSIVITESTVGPGIVEGLVGPIIEKESGLSVSRDFGLASCPERSDPGRIMKDMKTIPRIIGATDKRCGDRVTLLYEKVLGVKAVRVSSPKTANAVKLTENIFRDVNIALSNEFAILFEEFGIDAMEVIRACATKYNFIPHYPGAGVGGPCLPSNSYYLIAEGLKAGNIPYLVRMAREINDRMPEHVVELTSEALNEVGKTILGSRIAILGVAYKPDVKDIQLTPVEKVAKRLVEMGARLELYDPMFRGETVWGLKVAPKLERAVKGADCIVLGTAHREFGGLDLPALATLAGKKTAFVDARGMVDPKKATAAGFVYYGVGRKLEANAVPS
jgi:nucleotide sugar dehydrogenase